jgi:hypothetical protein
MVESGFFKHHQFEPYFLPFVQLHVLFEAAVRRYGTFPRRRGATRAADADEQPSVHQKKVWGRELKRWSGQLDNLNSTLYVAYNEYTWNPATGEADKTEQHRVHFHFPKTDGSSGAANVNNRAVILPEDHALASPVASDGALAIVGCVRFGSKWWGGTVWYERYGGFENETLCVARGYLPVELRRDFSTQAWSTKSHEMRANYCWGLPLVLAPFPPRLESQ